ncbi:phosphatase PAP2 family protein [Hymenobacter sp. M29]|uniref:Phosphatase PAP2 family protein n=1 Tax=Hymenobacter mellowenesis TaxID=3063995 RepID=A0ABT9A4V8_9BACT|nr:phosphatase PAP2 family protein [Hymenobacter sp. M29]MDO7844874.1 phosphatase PAP2 family protein [Hymenobacter sp. M29]
MNSYYPCRALRLFVALFFSLSFAASSSAHTANFTSTASDSTGLAADSLAIPTASDTIQARPASAKTAPADSLVHIHPRGADGRISDYTVAPGVTWHYENTKPFRWLLHIPRDLGQAPGYIFRKENKETFIGLATASVALWVADQAIIDWSQDFGKFIGLKAASTQKTLVYIPFRVGSANLPFEFNVPDNLNSTFYFLGDGWTHLTVASSFWIYGGIKKDNRALQTSSQLGEAILTTGLVVQTLKRLTGRQSPYVATQDRGEWHLFPSYSRYQSFVPNYDAFPTGHLATAMATVTVIADNYPEYRFIRPVGYSLMGLLGYSMLNNGVHWASDYPIGIALGYAFAKIAVRNGRTRVEATSTGAAANGTGMAPPRKPRPWFRQGRFSPYTYGPFTGASWSLHW